MSEQPTTLLLSVSVCVEVCLEVDVTRNIQSSIGFGAGTERLGFLDIGNQPRQLATVILVAAET